MQDLLDQAASPGPALDVLDEPRRAYQIEYARAQMLLPERPMIITSEINRSFNSAYRVLAQLQKNYDADKAAELHQWLYDGFSEAAWVHRQVLRCDLGVDKPISDFHAALRMLQDTRKASIDRGIVNRGLGIDAVGGYTSGVQPPGASVFFPACWWRPQVERFGRAAKLLVDELAARGLAVARLTTGCRHALLALARLRCEDTYVPLAAGFCDLAVCAGG